MLRSLIPKGWWSEGDLIASGILNHFSDILFFSLLYKLNKFPSQMAFVTFRDHFTPKFHLQSAIVCAIIFEKCWQCCSLNRKISFLIFCKWKQFVKHSEVFHSCFEFPSLFNFFLLFMNYLFYSKLSKGRLFINLPFFFFYLLLQPFLVLTDSSKWSLR